MGESSDLLKDLIKPILVNPNEVNGDNKYNECSSVVMLKMFLLYLFYKLCEFQFIFLGCILVLILVHLDSFLSYNWFIIEIYKLLRTTNRVRFIPIFLLFRKFLVVQLTTNTPVHI